MSAFADPIKRVALRSRGLNPVRIKGNQGHSSDSRSSSTGDRRGTHSQLYNPGDTVRESGIYEVIHDGLHRIAHEVVMIAEDLFPTCDVCLQRVRFRLVRTAPYIFSDEDFEKEE